jgi:arylsulfatase A-like enzyme
VNKTNLIIFLADDLGWTDLGCYGSAFYETPNLDRLASQGMRFTNAYAACPVCSPTRASLLTGKYPARVGVTDWIDWGAHLHPARGALIDAPYLKGLPLSERTIAQVLRENAYRTWHVGKWHLGGEGHLPHQMGFELNVGGCHHGSPGRGGYFSPWSIEALAGEDVPAGTYLSDYLTDRAIELIRSDGAPFFLNMWYYLVHTPIQAPEPLVERYRQKAKEIGLDRREAFAEGNYYPCEHKKGKRIQRRLFHSDPVYAAMVEKLDESVGRILGALEETGKKDDTLVIFTSDNGGLATSEGSPTTNRPLSEGKGWMYDGGTREPLIVRWPGVTQPGAVTDAVVTSPDFYPTVVDAVGLTDREPSPPDGKSFAHILRGEHEERGPVFWHYPHYGNQGGTPGAAVRHGDWKLIRFFEDGHEELYNVKEDAGEEKNRAAEHPDKVRELSETLEDWLQKVEAKLPARNPDYVPWQDREPCSHFSG